MTDNRLSISMANSLVQAARDLVENIRERGSHDNWKALARLLDQIPRQGEPDPIYKEWCRSPAACMGKGYCPLDPVCSD